MTSIVGAILGVAIRAHDPLSLSLEDCLRLAQRTSEDVEVARAGQGRAEGDGLRARSEYFPRINSFASYERTLDSRFEGVFEGNGDAGAAGQGMSPFAGLESLPFGQRHAYQMGVAVTQPLFTGGRIQASNRGARVRGRLADLVLTSTRAQVTLDAAQLYYDTVLTERLLEIAEATLALSKDSLGQARLARAAGTLAEYDVLRAEVAVANQRPIVVQRRLDRDIASVRLRLFLDLPGERTLRLTTPLETDAEPPAVAELARAVALVGARRDGARAPEREAAAAVELREAALEGARARRWPSIGASTQFARVGYPDDGVPAWGDFQTNWTAGLTVELSIFTGGRLTGDIRVAEADLREARARQQRTSELTRLDTRKARDLLAAARAIWESSGAAVALARRTYEIAELRMREGIATQLELADARVQLFVAQGDRARAARDLQVARIRLALLPELPLSLVTGTPEIPAAAPAASVPAAGAQSAAGQTTTRAVTGAGPARMGAAP